MSAARILLVDAHEIMREGLRLLLHQHPEFQVVGDASETEIAWAAIVELAPDLVILDLELPGVGGVALAKKLRLNYPAIKVLILTGHAEPRIVKEALCAGVQGWVLKTNDGVQLIAALRAVLAGQTFLSPEISTQGVSEYRRNISTNGEASNAPSARDLVVLKQIAEGRTTRQIAHLLGVGVRTVEILRLRLNAKLGVKGVAGLTTYALREGLTTL